MTRLFLASTLVAALAVPAFADDSPAESFGEARATNSSSPSSMNMAARMTEGDSIDERIPLGENEIVTRSDSLDSQGIRQLAENMGVDANNYTRAELAKMFIGKYD